MAYIGYGLYDLWPTYCSSRYAPIPTQGALCSRLATQAACTDPCVWIARVGTGQCVDAYLAAKVRASFWPIQLWSTKSWPA